MERSKTIICSITLIKLLKIKKIIKIAFIFLFFALASCSKNDVYICTGPNSTRYHKTENCNGLNRCSCNIKKVTIKIAKKMERTPCKICHNKNEN